MATQEYPNSHLIDPSTYDPNLDGLAANVPLRLSRSAHLADRGALRAQRDWQRATGITLPPSFSGGMGPQYNMLAACVPETLPDRIEMIAYIIELSFLVDDVVDAAEKPLEAAAPYMAAMVNACDAVMAGGGGGGGVDAAIKGSPVAGLLADVARAMVAVDPGPAMVALGWVGKWMKATLACPGGERDVCDLDGYLEYRNANVGTLVTFGMLIFAMGLEIPEDQQQICLDLAAPLWLHFSLTNDYHSWERERENASKNGLSSVTNAIWVLMNKHSMTCDQAKEALREKARQYTADYLRVIEAAKMRDDLCDDAKRFFDVAKFGISGNIAWGLGCCRYNPQNKLTAAQLEMAEAVRADKTVGWCTGQENHATDGIAGHSKAGINGGIANGIATNGAANSAVGSAVNGDSHRKMEVVQDVPALSADALEAPSRYIDSLPGKGIRNKTIDALNIWYKVPQQETAIISKAIHLLHGVSLMLDDIEDSSQLRRGKPAAHMVFGTMQTINSAGFRFLSAIEEVRKLGSQRCMDVFCEELRDLYVGQSHDLAWTCHLSCPTEEEYLAMVDGKTAGLFRMLAKMLDAQSDSPTKPDVALITRFMTLLGRFFQIRDDYMNLTSADYTKQKGFCEDLDEGKYSLPVIHALGRCGDAESSDIKSPKANRHAAILQNLLSQRHVAGKMTLEQKNLFLEQLQQTRSLEYTRQALVALEGELKVLAKQMGMHQNEKLAALLEILKV